MNFDDLFKVPIKNEVSVASKNELTIKKSPGIVTLISDKEVANSGETIMEVL